MAWSSCPTQLSIINQSWACSVSALEWPRVPEYEGLILDWKLSKINELHFTWAFTATAKPWSRKRSTVPPRQLWVHLWSCHFYYFLPIIRMGLSFVNCWHSSSHFISVLTVKSPSIGSKSLRFSDPQKMMSREKRDSMHRKSTTSKKGMF